MAEEKNKAITLVLIFIIIIAIITIVYVNLPKEEDTKHKTTNEESDTLLTFTFRDEITNYTLNDFEILEEFTGKGTYIKTGWLPDVVIEGPYNFTGIRVDTILNQIDNLPKNYTIRVSSSDGWTTDYNQSTVSGQVSIYNESGNVTQIGGATMILAYKKEGTYMTDAEEGPLQVAFINDGKITSSKLWTKMVVSLEIVE
jgi:hypothetical protein